MSVMKAANHDVTLSGIFIPVIFELLRLMFQTSQIQNQKRPNGRGWLSGILWVKWSMLPLLYIVSKIIQMLQKTKELVCFCRLQHQTEGNER